MDKKEPVKGTIQEPVQKQEEKESDNLFDIINGFSVTISVQTTKETDVKDWDCYSEVNISISKDGEKWATATMPVKSIDRNPDAAITTTLLAISGFMNDDDIYDKLLEKLENGETESIGDNE